MKSSFLPKYEPKRISALWQSTGQKYSIELEIEDTIKRIELSCNNPKQCKFI